MTAFSYDDLLGFVRGLDADDLTTVDARRVPGAVSEAWAEDLHTDLSEGVLRILKMERFLADVARTGADLMGRFGSAAITYASDAEQSRVERLAEDDEDET
ncbi:MAG: hypothetical protein HKN01_04600 [Acidimicrobiia bacterium]|nr:hypothetical protein [Acidimicrobiia bacterium]NNF69029.1 hypothetical protein [Acidimicrobiia bacterium]